MLGGNFGSVWTAWLFPEDLDGTEMSLADFPTVEFSGVPQSVIAAYSHTCVLRGSFPENNILCFGDEERLGYQSLSYGGNGSLPVGAPSHPIGGAIVEVSLGYASTCVLKREDERNRVYCWGDNDRGQLGYGHTNPVATTPESISIMDQGPVDIGENVVSVYAAETVSCVLTDNGNIKCWGQGSSGGDWLREFGEPWRRRSSKFVRLCSSRSKGDEVGEWRWTGRLCSYRERYASLLGKQ